MCGYVCVGGRWGGGVNVMQLCICTVFQKCEVYCMHLISFFILPLSDSNFNHSLSGTESNSCLATSGVNDVGVCGGVQLAAIATVDQHLPNLFRHGDVGHHHTQLLVIHWTQA